MYILFFFYESAFFRFFEKQRNAHLQIFLISVTFFIDLLSLIIVIKAWKSCFIFLPDTIKIVCEIYNRYCMNKFDIFLISSSKFKNNNSQLIGPQFDKRCKEINVTKDKMTLVRQRYQLIYCRNVEDQRTLESDKTRGPPDVMQPKVLVSYVTFS